MNYTIQWAKICQFCEVYKKTDQVNFSWRFLWAKNATEQHNTTHQQIPGKYKNEHIYFVRKLMISVSVSIFSLDWVLSFSMLFSIDIDLSSSRRILLMTVMTSSSLASMVALSISNSSGSFPPLFAMLYGGVSQKWGLKSRFGLRRTLNGRAFLHAHQRKSWFKRLYRNNLISLKNWLETDWNNDSNFHHIAPKKFQLLERLHHFESKIKGNIEIKHSVMSTLLYFAYSRKVPTSRSSNTMTPQARF